MRSSLFFQRVSGLLCGSNGNACRQDRPDSLEVVILTRRIPPTGVGGSFKPSLLWPRTAFPNTPDGSRGIVQVQPTGGARTAFRNIPSRCATKGAGHVF